MQAWKVVLALRVELATFGFSVQPVQMRGTASIHQRASGGAPTSATEMNAKQNIFFSMHH